MKIKFTTNIDKKLLTELKLIAVKENTSVNTLLEKAVVEKYINNRGELSNECIKENKTT